MPATGTGAKTRKYRDETINLRASQRQKSLIDRAVSYTHLDVYKRQ